LVKSHEATPLQASKNLEGYPKASSSEALFFACSISNDFSSRNFFMSISTQVQLQPKFDARINHSSL